MNIEFLYGVLLGALFVFIAMFLLTLWLLERAYELSEREYKRNLAQELKEELERRAKALPQS